MRMPILDENLEIRLRKEGVANTLPLADFGVGSYAHEQYIIPQRIVDFMLHDIGDVNALHVNDDYAKEFGFEGRIVHGVILPMRYSKLLGTTLPGNGTIFSGMDGVRWLRPLYVDDVIDNYAIIEKVEEGRKGLWNIDMHCITGKDGKVTTEGYASLRFKPSSQAQ